jgi:hypothetical protein
LWSEEQTVRVENGIYQASLGTAVPLNGNIFVSDQLYLELAVWNTDTESWEIMTPRQRITSVGFALQAENAETLNGLAASDFALVSHSHDAAYVNEGQANSVSSAMIRTGTVNSSDIADNSLTAYDLATNSVGAAEIAPNSVGTSEVINDSLTYNDLAANSVRSSEIATGAVGPSEINWSLNYAGSDLNGGILSLANDSVATYGNLPMGISGEVTGNPTYSPVIGVFGGAPGLGHGTHLRLFPHTKIGVGGASDTGHGVAGVSDSGCGVYGTSTSGYAGYFEGDVKATGELHVEGTAKLFGNLGIGVENPTVPLYIQQTVSGLTFPCKIENHAAGDGPGESDVGILFSTGGSGSGDRGKGALVYETTGTWNRGSFHFLQESGANSSNPDMADSVLTIMNSGSVGIGTRTPEGLLHISAGTAGDAQVVIEADTDNSNEEDQPSILFKQDGGLVNGRIGFEEGSNNFRVRATESIQFIVRDAYNKDVLGATLDENGIADLPLKTTYLLISAHAFRPMTGDSIVWSYSYDDIALSTTGVGGYYAPISLPDGAVISEVICWWTANSKYLSYFDLYRIELSTGDKTVITAFDGGHDENRHYSQGSIAHEIVDNQRYNYVASILMKEGVKFYGARVRYTYQP